MPHTIYPPLLYHTDKFHCPENLLCSPSIHPSTQPCKPLAATDLFTISTVLPYSIHVVICFRFPPCLCVAWQLISFYHWIIFHHRNIGGGLVAKLFLTLATPWTVACQAPIFSSRIFLGKNTGVGCHFHLQEIFPTHGSNLSLLHCKQFL